MPAFTLPKITITPNRVISNVMPASTSLWVGPVLLELPVVIKTPCGAGPAASGPGVRATGLAGPIRFFSRSVCRSVSWRRQEARVLHQDLVTLFLDLDPLGVIGPGQEGRVKRAALHEVLPFGRGADLLEQLDVIFDLVLGRPRRHE